ncbi:hypothetical protein [Shimia ponticola]|uniref:hypothetical protein n=1 Tax=Shimia ponticola TaxID=2582893 RepID=UPI0011BFD80B|nr:hypothetical protein [Shimia ponticola]
MSLNTAVLDPAAGSVEGQADALYGYDVNVVDWNDLVARAVADGNFDFLTVDLEFLPRFSNGDGPKSFSVTRDGDPYWQDGRSYFIALGPVESSFLVHDSFFVGGQTLYLGSWFGTPPYLIEGALEEWSGTSGNDVMDANFIDADGTSRSDLGQYIDAGDGNNRVYDGAGDDVVVAGSGKDKFFAGAGADSYDGGGGRNDLVDYRLSSEGLTINAIEASASTGIAAGDTFTNVEKIFGTDFDDIIVLGSGVTTARGGEGNDIIFDSDARDFMTGADGVDTFVFGAGDGQRDVIWDFEQGTDLIDISAWGVASFDDLTITAKKSDRWIVTYNDEQLEVVMDGGRTDLTAEDFELPTSQGVGTFEDLGVVGTSPFFSAPLNNLATNYNDLNWSNNWNVFNTEEQPEVISYNIAATSGVYAARNGSAQDGVITADAGEAFSFISGQFTGFGFIEFQGSNTVSTLVVRGELDGVFVGEQQFEIVSDETRLIEFDQAIFGNVDQVTLSAFEGDPADSRIFSVDDLVINVFDDLVLV